MAAEKASFVLYHDIRGPLDLLSMDERGQLFTAILDYSERGIVPDFTGELRMAFAFIRTALDRDAEKWEQKRTKRADAGRQGGLAKAANVGNTKRSQASVANVANASNTKQRQIDEANLAVPAPAPDPVAAPVPVNSSPPFDPPQENSRAHKDKADYRPDRFASLWNWYPHDHRGNKQRALRAWDNLRPDEQLMDVIGRALMRQSKTDEWQRGIGIPHLSTWLNGSSWEGWEGPSKEDLAIEKRLQEIEREEE